MVQTETYTLNNLRHELRDPVILYSHIEPSEAELQYINQHSFNAAYSYAQSRGWKLLRNDINEKQGNLNKTTATVHHGVENEKKTQLSRSKSNSNNAEHQENDSGIKFTKGVSLLGLWICIILAAVVFFSVILNDGSPLIACLLSIGLNLLGVWFFRHGPKDFQESVVAEQRRFEEEHKEKMLNGGYKCPNCGKAAGHPIGAVGKGISVGAFGLASNKIGKAYKCANCGYMW